MSKLTAALKRAARTVAQSAIALIGSAQLVEHVDWKLVVSGAGLAGFLSLLTSAVTDLPEAASGAE